MKQFLSLVLILCLLLSLTACGMEKVPQTRFYYLRTEDTIVYGQEDGFITPLPREISQETPLDAALQLYLDGPMEEGYYNPIPSGTYLLSTLYKEDVLVIVLSREFSALDGIQLTLAGACLTATCRDLAGVEQIQVRSGEQIYDFDVNSFVFLDDGAGK